METYIPASRGGTAAHPITVPSQPGAGTVHSPRHGGTGSPGPVSLRPIQTRDGFQANKALKQIKNGHASAPIKLESAFAKAAEQPTPAVKGPIKLESGSASKLALKSAAPLKK